MKPGTDRVTVEWIRSGQPRPYADSISEFILTNEWIPSIGPQQATFEPRPVAESIIKQHAKSWKFFYEKGDPQADWASPMLETFEKLGPGKYRFVIREAFTD